MSTAISWTDETWNPVVGCSQVSPGCAHCYARDLHTVRHQAFNRGKMQKHPQYKHPFEKVQLMPDRLTYPLSWRKPKRIFVNSMSDLFHEDVPDGFIDQVFGIMRMTPWHTYQILTKRPERMRDYMLETWLPDATQDVGDNRDERTHRAAERFLIGRSKDNRFWTADERSISIVQPWPLPNVHLGVSVENQRWVSRIPTLFETPAAVRFLSCEPLLGPLDLEYPQEVFGPDGPPMCCDGRECGCLGKPTEPPLLHGIDWVIAGGESGELHRPAELEWFRSIRDQCADLRIPFFLKQLGGHPDARAKDKAVLDGRTHTDFPHGPGQ